MSKKAIVLGITADHAFAAGSLLASILEHDDGFDATVVIYHDGLSPQQQAAFLRLWPNCRFLPFVLADLAVRIGVPADAAGLLSVIKRYSPLVLAKLALPGLLAEFDQVVWLDADMLVRGSLCQVWDFDCLAWRPLPESAHARRAGVFGRLPAIPLDSAVPLLNGGLLGLGRGFLTKGGGVQTLHDMARLLIQRTDTEQVDELTWYLTAASQSLPVTALPLRFNHPVTSPGVETATVVHAVGRHKFWNATPLAQLFPDWSRHQARWVECGGDAYTGPVGLGEVHPVEPHAVLHWAEARAFWLRFFPELRAALPLGMTPELRHDRRWLRLLLHGSPEDQHLRLVRLAQRRRIGLELHLRPEQREPALAAIRREVADLNLQHGQTLSLPVTDLRAALAVAAAVLVLG